jgi:hypothetical protein
MQMGFFFGSIEMAKLEAYYCKSFYIMKYELFESGAWSGFWLAPFIPDL